MLEKYYYKDYLNKRLVYLRDWARNADTYRNFIEIGKRVEVELFREKRVFLVQKKLIAPFRICRFCRGKNGFRFFCFFDV